MIQNRAPSGWVRAVSPAGGFIGVSPYFSATGDPNRPVHSQNSRAADVPVESPDGEGIQRAVRKCPLANKIDSVAQDLRREEEKVKKLLSDLKM